MVEGKRRLQKLGFNSTIAVKRKEAGIVPPEMDTVSKLWTL
jgi:hypothetical protein